MPSTESESSREFLARGDQFVKRHTVACAPRPLTARRLRSPASSCLFSLFVWSSLICLQTNFIGLVSGAKEGDVAGIPKMTKNIITPDVLPGRLLTGAKSGLEGEREMKTMGEAVKTEPAEEAKDASNAAWPEDDDDTAEEIASNTKKEVIADDVNNVNAKSKVNSEAVSLGEKKEQSTSEWPDDDDDDDDTVEKSTSNVEKGAAATDEDGEMVSEDDDDDDDETTLSKLKVGSGASDATKDKSDPKASQSLNENMDDQVLFGEKKGSTTSDWPEDDDDDDVKVQSSLNVDSNDVEKESDINIIPGDDISPKSAYHRNQSSEGEDAAGEDEEPTEKVADEDVTAENPVEAPGLGAEEAGEPVSQEETGTGAEIDSAPEMPFDITGGDAGDMVGENIDGIPAGGENTVPMEGHVPMEGSPADVIVPGAEQSEQQQQLQPPIGNIGWDDDEDEDSFFDTIKSTFQILLLAAIFTSVLVFRKRVMDRLQADPSRGVPGAMMDEFVDVVIRLATWAAARLREGSSGGGSGNGAGGSNATQPASAAASRRGPETIPLSTATDEEWGWEDDDMGTTNMELSSMGGGRGDDDQAKENDDLAMAIAMSLSETEKGANAAKTTSVPSTANKAISKKPLPTTSRPSNNSGSTFGSSRIDSVKPMAPLRKNSGPTPTPRVPAAEAAPPPSSAPAASDSIEDLLGQMGGSGGPVITSFGQKPNSIAKPKAAPKKETSSDDDIFASMGLSSFPNSGGASSARPAAAPASGGWQATTAARAQPTISSAPKSAPLTSLLADTMDDDMDADSWGDDEDLDDLLDD